MKTLKEKIEIMQAYERGEQIERYYDNEWGLCKNPIWNWGYADYRVKPKTKYVPFDTAEEFLAAQRKHGGCLLFSIEDGIMVAHNVSITLYGRVYERKENQFGYDCEYLGDLEDLLLDDYKFKDGTPCGKEVKL